MNSQSTKFLTKKKIAVGTEEFGFAKPEAFNFTAGQYLIWRFPNLFPVDDKGNQRDFTISSAPFEDRLSFATRLRDSAFKNWALNLKPGDEIEIDGPHGDLILPSSPINQSSNQPVIFIAGGIGITPFRSMSAQANFQKLPHKIHLFHFEKSQADAAYWDELKNLERSNVNFKFIPVLTSPPPDWTGETGHLTSDLLRKHLNSTLNSYLYFVAGPPKMVEAIRATLVDEVKVSVENIMSENFGGY